VLIPWSAFWERNYFVEWSAALKALLTSNYTRGAISGLGLVNVWAALAELADMFGGRSHAQSDDSQSPMNRESDFRNPQ
jgi:hypothetical protein